MQVLINTLADSKTTSSIIKERVEESEKTEIEIDLARKKYTPVATRGSIIYFVIADLSGIDPMYQYSLQYYQTLFDRWEPRGVVVVGDAAVVLVSLVFIRTSPYP